MSTHAKASLSVASLNTTGNESGTAASSGIVNKAYDTAHKPVMLYPDQAFVAALQTAQPIPLHLLTNALSYLGEVEEALDRQIHPQEKLDPRADEYAVVITAKQWRAFSNAMMFLETLSRSV